MLFFLSLYAIAFLLVTWYRFSLGVFLLFLLLPTYVLRFSIGPLPTTFLEVMIWIVCIVGVIKHVHSIEESILLLSKRYTLFFIGILLFLATATIAVIPADSLRAALGEWKAFYIEPVLLFFVLFLSRDRLVMKSDIILPLLLSGLATAVLAVYQHFTGWLVPYAFWENRETYRVTAWYGFPNGVGLFLAPIVVLAAGVLRTRFSDIRLRYFKRDLGNWNQGILSNTLFFVSLLHVPVGTLAVWYAKSTGGLMGILAGIGILLVASSKTRALTLWTAGIGLIILLVTPQLAGVREELSLHDRSGQIRIGIWKETSAFLHDSPLLGAGMASYDEAIRPYHQTVNGEGIEIFHHPHNIFLTMWVNIGLFGLIAFLLLLIGFYIPAYRQHVLLVALMSVIVVTGMVDSPYIKNDLAVLFWVFPLLLVARQDDFV